MVEINDYAKLELQTMKGDRYLISKQTHNNYMYS